MEKNATAEETMETIADFLGQIKSEKEAAESFKDKAEATPANQSKPDTSEGKTKQTNAGKEMSQAAEDSNSTAPDASPNSEEKAKKPTDDQGPKTLGTDDPVTEDGDIGPVRKQEITQEQKTARAEKLGNAILQKLASSLAEQAEEQQPAEEKQADEGQPESTGDAFLDGCLQKAAAHAAEAHDSFLLGMLKRADDEKELAEADFEKIGIDKKTLDSVGGISGLLDKVAMEDTAAIMPEGLEEGLMDEGAPAVPAVPGAPEAPAGEDIEEVGAMLEEAGVTPEDIDEVAEIVAELQAAGVSPQEAAAAINQVVSEGLGGVEDPAAEVAEEVTEPPAEEAAEEVAEEATKPPVEEAAEEVADEEKVATDRVNAAADFLRQRMGLQQKSE